MEAPFNGNLISFDQGEERGICVLSPAVISMKYRCKGKEIGNTGFARAGKGPDRCIG